MQVRAIIKAAFATVIGWPLLAGAQGISNDIDDRFLASHNRERTSLGLPELKWDADLAAEAKAWADGLAESGQMRHSTAGSGFGENLWAGTSNYFAPETMVGDWIEEKAQFKRGTFPHVSRTGRFEDVGHYSQVVWRDTTHVGCAVAKGENDDFLVCRYSRPGNVVGQIVY